MEIFVIIKSDFHNVLSILSLFFTKIEYNIQYKKIVYQSHKKIEKKEEFYYNHFVKNTEFLAIFARTHERELGGKHVRKNVQTQ